jgi:hypothetical protein
MLEGANVNTITNFPKPARNWQPRQSLRDIPSDSPARVLETYTFCLARIEVKERRECPISREAAGLPWKDVLAGHWL